MTTEDIKWADRTRCQHGRTFSEPCDYCEIVGLQESLKWMTRSVASKEKRLAELLEKTKP